MVTLSEDATDFLERLISTEGIDLSSAESTTEDDCANELKFEVNELLRKAELSATLDESLTGDQKTLLTYLIWALVHQTGLVSAPAGSVINQEIIKLRASGQMLPAADVLTTEYLTKMFKVMYMLGCLVIQRDINMQNDGKG